MGRPTKFNRDDAIEIAMNTFWAKGFEPTSVSDLASAMSITRSSFYNSFRSRESVFDEALKRYQSDDVDLKVGTDEGFCPAACVRQFFYDVCEKLAADPEGRGCLIINCHVQASDDAPAPSGVQTFINTKRREFELIATAGQQAGLVPAHLEPKAVADALLALLIGVNVMGKDIRDGERLWASVDTVLCSLGFVPT